METTQAEGIDGRMLFMGGFWILGISLAICAIVLYTIASRTGREDLWTAFAWFVVVDLFLIVVNEILIARGWS